MKTTKPDIAPRLRERFTEDEIRALEVGLPEAKPILTAAARWLRKGYAGLTVQQIDRVIARLTAAREALNRVEEEDRAKAAEFERELQARTRWAREHPEERQEQLAALRAKAAAEFGGKVIAT